MSLEALIKTLTEAIDKNTEQLVKMNEGRDAAIAKLEAVDAKPAPTRSRKTKAEKEAEATPAKEAEATPAKEAEATPAKEAEATPAKEAEATPAKDAEAAAFHGVDLTDKDAVREIIAGNIYNTVDGATITEEQRDERNLFLKSALNEVGAENLTGLTDTNDRKRVIFYVLRHVSGNKVDFAADYDFDGAVDQGAAADPFA